MKHRGARAYQCCCHEQGWETSRDRQKQESEKRQSHTERQGIGHRFLVRIESHQGLQKRRSYLIRERDQTHLREIKMKRIFQQRINRGQKRGKHVIQKMTHANSAQNIKGGFVRYVE